MPDKIPGKSTALLKLLKYYKTKVVYVKGIYVNFGLFVLNFELMELIIIIMSYEFLIFGAGINIKKFMRADALTPHAGRKDCR